MFVLNQTFRGFRLPLNNNTALDIVMSSIWARSLNETAQSRVRAETRIRLVPRGGMVCHSGSEVEYWKGVIDGMVKMSVASPDGRTSTLAGLTAGAWFGEGAVLRSAKWDFDGVAMRDTMVALVPRTTFLWLLDDSAAFNRFVIGQLNERLSQFLSVIEAERLEVPETRVARCLAWLFNPVLYPNVGRRLELTQQELGYLSGVPRQRVNRALRLLEDAGLLEVKYGALRVLDLDGLQRYRAVMTDQQASTTPRTTAREEKR